MDIEDVDLLVFGGGKAGKTLAMEVAQQGRKVAMVERAMIGGTCINVACIPTKTIINSGRVLGLVRRAAEFGISGAADPRMELELLRRRKEDVVDTMVKGQLSSFLGSGMDFILGEATFVGPRTVEVALNDGGTRDYRVLKTNLAAREGRGTARSTKGRHRIHRRPRCHHHPSRMAEGLTLLFSPAYLED